MTDIDETAAMSGSAGPARGSEEALPVLPDAGFVFDKASGGAGRDRPPERLPEPRWCRMASLRSKRHRKQHGRESHEAVRDG